MICLFAWSTNYSDQALVKSKKSTCALSLIPKPERLCTQTHSRGRVRTEGRFMSANFVTIKLPRREIHYLINAKFLSPLHIEAVRAAQSSSGGSAVLKLSRNLAEEFREAFTNELAKVGFDEND